MVLGGLGLFWMVLDGIGWCWKILEMKKTGAGKSVIIE